MSWIIVMPSPGRLVFEPALVSALGALGAPPHVSVQYPVIGGRAFLMAANVYEEWVKKDLTVLAVVSLMHVVIHRLDEEAGEEMSRRFIEIAQVVEQHIPEFVKRA